MSIKLDYYEVLEIHRSASDDEIKKAYRSAAMKYHPDRNPGDKNAEEKFKLASEAYEVLGDGQKRQVYDQYGHAGLSGTDFHPFSNVEDIFSSFGDVFEDFFGFGGGRRSSSSSAKRPRRGGDFRYDISISFLESYHGCEKEIEFKKEESCETCEGLGHPSSSKPTTCPSCQGMGKVTHSQGFFTISSACPQCRGEGRIIKVLCRDCNGKGRQIKHKKLKVKIPAGVNQDNQLVLKGEGEMGRAGAAAGDLYVVVHVEESEDYKREENNLVAPLSISFTQAALGAVLKVKLIDEEVEIEVPAGIETGERIEVKGKGFSELKYNQKGNWIFEVEVKTPKNLNARQKELLEEFAKESGEENVPRGKSKKKKGFFG